MVLISNLYCKEQQQHKRQFCLDYSLVVVARMQEVIRLSGGVVPLAQMLGINGTRIPLERVVVIEEITGITKEDQRPDIFRRSYRKPVKGKPIKHVTVKGKRQRAARNLGQ